MWQQDLVFPQVPRGFWRRFRRRWGKPLRALEEVISLSASLGADPKSPRFQAMDEAYSGRLRICTHACACTPGQS